MRIDAYTKVVLTVIAVYLVWLSLGGPSLITPVAAQNDRTDRVVLAGEPLNEPVEYRTGSAIAGVPSDPEGTASKVLNQPVDISLGNIDLFNLTSALAPVARSAAAAERLDLLPEYRAAFQQELEAVVVGGIVAAGHLDPAVHIQMIGREVKHWAGAHAGPNDVEPALRQSPDQFRFEFGRMRAAVAPDCNAFPAFARR